MLENDKLFLRIFRWLKDVKKNYFYKLKKIIPAQKLNTIEKKKKLGKSFCLNNKQVFVAYGNYNFKWIKRGNVEIKYFKMCKFSFAGIFVSLNAMKLYEDVSL